MKTVLSRIAMACALLLAATGPAPAQDARRADLLIRGGMVYDGSETPGRQVDVAVTDGRISLVGDAANVRARRVIDATGLIVAPGFIDPHTHSLSDLRAEDATRRRALNHIAQGVTTIFVGNDGDGSFQVAAQRAELERLGVGVNVASFVGFGAVRESVLGTAARAPSEPELTRMRGHVARAMCEGAFGFSTGLYYAPQSFSETDEVIALAREAATRGGLYESHLRSEGAHGVIEAVEEALRIGREADMPVHFAHIKVAGANVEGLSDRFIAMINAERTAGRRISADQYPWSASGTRISNALIPRWTQENGGQAAMRRRLADTALQERLLEEIADNIRGRGGADSLLITTGPHRGQRLNQVAESLGVTPAEAARRIAAEGDARLASFNMHDADIRNFMAQPWVVSSSDATIGHPRRYGSFAMKFARFVRDERLLNVEQFIHRSSGLTAETFGIEGRGYLREGYAADVVAFDPRRYAARATYEEPELFAEGVHYVIVNGQVTLDRGTHTGALAGAALAKQPPQGACP